jgi:hypothetical protein
VSDTVAIDTPANRATSYTVAAFATIPPGSSELRDSKRFDERRDSGALIYRS